MYLIHWVKYYRLKQVDKDGGIAYSKIVSVNTVPSNIYVIYPNPAKSLLNVGLATSITGKVSFTITDLTGRKVMAKESVLNGQTTIPITINQLSPGVYFIAVIAGSKTLGITKFVKQ
jgi:hypothetical protein